MKSGKSCSVNMGTYKVQGMGKWDMAGIKTALLDATQFGDVWQQWLLGLSDGGEITFGGILVTPDAAGQDALRQANLLNSQLTDLRFYIDNTSYWAPSTTNPSSYFLITGWRISADKAGLVTSDFTAKLSGAPQLN
jgi:hypothetical protein